MVANGVLVIHPNGSVLGKPFFDVSEELENSDLLIDGMAQRAANLRQKLSDTLADLIMQEEETQLNISRYYLGFDSLDNKLKAIPMVFGMFNLPAFGSKEYADEAIKIIEDCFSLDEIKLMFI